MVRASSFATCLQRPIFSIFGNFVNLLTLHCIGHGGNIYILETEIVHASIFHTLKNHEVQRNRPKRDIYHLNYYIYKSSLILTKQLYFFNF